MKAVGWNIQGDIFHLWIPDWGIFIITKKCKYYFIDKYNERRSVCALGNLLAVDCILKIITEKHPSNFSKFRIVCDEDCWIGLKINNLWIFLSKSLRLTSYFAFFPFSLFYVPYKNCWSKHLHIFWVHML